MRPVAFERRVCAALHDACAPRAGETLVVAVSGGPDSIALLTALHERHRRDELGWRLHAAHLNHGLRGAESDADERFVAAECRSRGIGLTAERASIEPGKASLEERARRVRYAFLERVATGASSRVVLTAHHADDQAETVLHHLIRGSGLRGVAGIRPVRPIRRGSAILLVRPMLGMTRSDILDYLRQRGQPFREDATNAAADRTRNRIRRRVLPMLEAELNPNTRAALARFATLARWMDEFLDDFATRTLDAAIREEADGRCVLDADALARQPPIIRVAVALRALQRLGAREQRLRFEHLCGLAGLMTADRTRRQVELPGRLSAVAARGRITLSRTSARRATPAARPTSRYA